MMPSKHNQTDWLAAVPPGRSLRWAVAAVLVVLYLLGVTGQWWLTSDSALYLGLGRSLAEGRGYVFNGVVSRDVTPGLPLMLAGVQKAFGPSMWGPNLLLALSGLATLWLVHRVMKRWSEARMALAVVICTGFSYCFYLNSHRVLTDVPFALFFWATLWAWERSRQGHSAWLAAGCLLAAIALIVRLPGLLAIGPLMLGLLLDDLHRRPRRRGPVALTALLLAGLSAGSVAALFLLRKGADAPLYVRSVFYVLRLTPATAAKRLLAEAVNFPRSLAEMFVAQQGFWVLGVVLFALMIAGGIVLWRRGQRVALLGVLPYVFAIGLFAGGKAIHPRYLVMIQPLIIYMTLAGLLMALRVAGAWLHRPVAVSGYLVAVTVFCVVVIGSNVPKVLRQAVYYGCLGHRGQQGIADDGRRAELLDAARRMGDLRSAGYRVSLSTDEESVLHFLTGLTVLETPIPRNRRYVDGRELAAALAANPVARIAAVKLQDAAGVNEGRRQELLRAGWRLDYANRRWEIYLKDASPASPSSAPCQPDGLLRPVTAPSP